MSKLQGRPENGPTPVRGLHTLATYMFRLNNQVCEDMGRVDYQGHVATDNNMPYITVGGVAVERLSWVQPREARDDPLVTERFTEEIKAQGLDREGAFHETVVIRREGERRITGTKSGRILVPKIVRVKFIPQIGEQHSSYLMYDAKTDWSEFSFPVSSTGPAYMMVWPNDPYLKYDDPQPKDAMDVALQTSKKLTRAVDRGLQPADVDEQQKAARIQEASDKGKDPHLLRTSRAQKYADMSLLRLNRLFGTHED